MILINEMKSQNIYIHHRIKNLQQQKTCVT